MLFAPVIAAALAASLLSAEQTQPFPWGRDYAVAQKAAESSKKPMMLYFTTDWCGWCKVMERETFVDAKVQAQAAARYVPVMLDAEKEGKELAAKYKVDAFPTFVFIQPSGDVVGVLAGFRNAADFQERVAQILDAKSEEARLKAALDRNPNDPVANAEMAIRLVGDGKVGEAEMIVDKIRKTGFKGTEMAKALSDLGQAYFGSNWKKAMAFFEESLACKDKATTSATFERLLIATLYAREHEASLEVARRMSDSPEASPEIQAQGKLFLKAEEHGKILQTPEQVADAFVKQLQGLPEGSRDEYYFTDLFMASAPVNYVIRSVNGLGTFEATYKTILNLWGTDRLKTVATETNRTITKDMDMATVRLDMTWKQFLPDDGKQLDSNFVVHLQLIGQSRRWYITSLTIQRQAQTD